MASHDRRQFLLTSAGALAAVALTPSVLPAAPRPQGAKLPVAVVGVGRHGRALLGELQKLDACQVVAIADTDESRLRAGARRTAGAASFATHREMLEKNRDIRAVIVATPTHAHRAVVEDCLAAGKDVFCEAPLASTVDDAQAIVQAARGASGRVFQGGLYARSNPIYSLARSFFRSDAVREVVSLRAQSCQKTTWRTPTSDPSTERAMNWQLDPEVSTGLPGEMGTHQFDVFHYFLGHYPSTVSGVGSIRLHADGRTMPDTVDCLLGFEKGPTLQYHATLASSFEGRHEVLRGSNATIKLAWTAGWMFKEADAPTQGWEVYANRQQFHNDEGITLIADATKLAAQGKLKEGVGLPNPPAYYALADFLRSLLEGAPVACSADEAFRATVVGILAHRAVSTGTPVAIGAEILKPA